MQRTRREIRVEGRAVGELHRGAVGEAVRMRREVGANVRLKQARDLALKAPDGSQDSFDLLRCGVWLEAKMKGVEDHEASIPAVPGEIMIVLR